MDPISLIRSVHSYLSATVSAFRSAVSVVAAPIFSALGSASPYLNLSAGVYGLVAVGASGVAWINKARKEQDFKKLREGLTATDVTLALADNSTQFAQSALRVGGVVSMSLTGTDVTTAVAEIASSARRVVTVIKGGKKLSGKQNSTIEIAFAVATIAAAVLALSLVADRFAGGHLPAKLSLLVTAVTVATVLRSVYMGVQKHHKKIEEKIDWFKEAVPKVADEAIGIALVVRHPIATYHSLKGWSQLV